MALVVVIVGAGAATVTAAAASAPVDWTISGVVTRVGGGVVGGASVVSLDDFGYRNDATSNADGSYRLTVDYPGRHHLAFTSGDCEVRCVRFDRTVVIDEADHAIALDAGLNDVLRCTSFGSQVGTPTVGETLTAVPGGFEPSAYDRTYSYQWYRSDGTMYQDIPGATGSTYVVAQSDVGSELEVDITGTSTAGWGSSVCGWTNTTAVVAGSTPTVPAPAPEPAPAPAPAPAPVTAPVPAPVAAATQVGVTEGPWLTGRPRLGKRLTAHAGGAPGATVGYQWLRDGLVVGGASGTTYRLTRADLGHRTSVRLTYSASGHTPTVLTTSPTRVVRR